MKDPVFLRRGWYTPNTYDTNFAPLPEKPGVYILAIRVLDMEKQTLDYDVCYVGSTDNLLQRCFNHPVKKKIMDELEIDHSKPLVFVNVVCFFKVCNDYRVREKRLIKQTQARYNKQWR